MPSDPASGDGQLHVAALQGTKDLMSLTIVVHSIEHYNRKHVLETSMLSILVAAIRHLTADPLRRQDFVPLRVATPLLGLVPAMCCRAPRQPKNLVHLTIHCTQPRNQMSWRKMCQEAYYREVTAVHLCAWQDLVPPRIATHVRSAGSSEAQDSGDEASEAAGTGAGSAADGGAGTPLSAARAAKFGTPEMDALHFFGVFDGHGGSR